uniref:SWI/SNF-related matrix-associated actin-dependent regulator of chromatin subfamily A-like protein 1 n=1 Tax=Cajanus cajan TaxID=3821 RepID=A0A151SSG2_CAJCA|nr:SWI/SNF-related matrix-associated actin-dependent regulator of chromatin subfamily A-like protein 1 [Cajanus cajan]
MFPLSSLSEAEKVLGEISGYNVQVENLDSLVQRAIAAASAVPDLQDRYHKIPSYIETKLLPFQREGVRFILQHGGRVLLADEMGLGKTLQAIHLRFILQAIAVASCVQDSWPVLILAPSSLRLQWATMIQQWLNIPSSDIVIVLPQTGGSNRGGFNVVSSSAKSSIRLDGLFNIISYDLVPKLQNMLITCDFKVVIADESHYLKNAQAKRTTASLPVIKKAQYALLLSGTPALSRPIELFKQLEALYPDVYRNVHEYGNRYCKGGFFGVYQGASNHEELHNLMKGTVMIRRLKKDVLSQLPVKRRQQVCIFITICSLQHFITDCCICLVIDSQVFLDLADKDMKQINSLFRELEMVKAKIKASKSQDEAETLKFTQKNLINKIYTDSAEAKIPSVLDYLGTVIEAGCKFLIFAHHQPMIDSIHEFLLKKKVGCIRIDGRTPAASRQQLVTEFQEKDAIKAAVLSIKAGGVGLTLTAASTVIFAELSWTPGDIIQAEDRAHRIGQVSSVNIYYLLANDTVDDIIWDVVQNKLDNLGQKHSELKLLKQMLDGHENALQVSAKASASLPANSPSKQKTLDQFVRRCDNMDMLEHEPNPKRPRN